jgi:hypothetical protein
MAKAVASRESLQQHALLLAAMVEAVEAVDKATRHNRQKHNAKCAASLERDDNISI